MKKTCYTGMLLLLIVILVPFTMLAMVVPAGIPAALTASPTLKVEVLPKPVIELEPAVVLQLSP